MADKSDLWKLRQVPKFGCGSFGGTSKGKQANSAILHSAAKKRSWIIWIQINYQKRNCLQSQVGHFVSWQHWITVLFSSPQSCTGVSAKSWSMNCPKFISNAVFDLDIKSDED